MTLIYNEFKLIDIWSIFVLLSFLSVGELSSAPIPETHHGGSDNTNDLPLLPR
jgi:hypothetical protein